MSVEQTQVTSILSTQFIFHKLRLQWIASMRARYVKPFRVCVIEQDKMNWAWQTSSISATQKWDNEMHTLLCQHSWRQVFYFEAGCSKSGWKVILTEIRNLGVIRRTQFTLKSSLPSFCSTVYKHKAGYCQGINVTENTDATQTGYVNIKNIVKKKRVFNAALWKVVHNSHFVFRKEHPTKMYKHNAEMDNCTMHSHVTRRIEHYFMLEK